jgi:hypothetical protein
MQPAKGDRRFASTMTQNYATLVSGVLIGLLEALEQGKKTKL